MFFGMLTIDNDGFSMVLGLSNHWFQWFSMVKDHWSNDGMVSMDRTGLIMNTSALLISPQGHLEKSKYCRQQRPIIPGNLLASQMQTPPTAEQIGIGQKLIEEAGDGQSSGCGHSSYRSIKRICGGAGLILLGN